jgi:hypothetical protein
MRALISIALVLACSGAVRGQTVFDSLDGPFGSASDLETSCAVNPHRLSFIPAPPHAIVTWDQPRPDGQGGMSATDRYDLLDHDDKTLTLRLEGDRRRTDAGGRPVWILRLTDDPQGYCWGRTDWPSVRCERQQLRCDSSTS